MRKRRYNRKRPLEKEKTSNCKDILPFWLHEFEPKYQRSLISQDQCGFLNMDLLTVERSVKIDRRRNMDLYFEPRRIVGYFVPVESPDRETKPEPIKTRKGPKYGYRGYRKRGYRKYPKGSASLTPAKVLTPKEEPASKEKLPFELSKRSHFEISSCSISLPCSPNPEMDPKLRCSERMRLRKQEEAHTEFYTTKFLSPRNSSSFFSSRNSLCKICLFSPQSALLSSKCGRCSFDSNFNVTKTRSQSFSPKCLTPCLVV